MTIEDKELLLKDLCARLPYGVICECYHTEFNEWDGKPFVANYTETLINIDVNGVFFAGGFSYEIDEVKPYLRPMSSMTEDEKQVLELCNAFVEPRSSELKVDFYNQYHLDYRGLIPKGLAIEAHKGMYGKE